MKVYCDNKDEIHCSEIEHDVHCVLVVGSDCMYRAVMFEGHWRIMNIGFNKLYFQPMKHLSLNDLIRDCIEQGAEVHAFFSERELQEAARKIREKTM